MVIWERYVIYPLSVNKSDPQGFLNTYTVDSNTHRGMEINSNYGGFELLRIITEKSLPRGVKNLFDLSRVPILEVRIIDSLQFYMFS